MVYYDAGSFGLGAVIGLFFLDFIRNVPVVLESIPLPILFGG